MTTDIDAKSHLKRGNAYYKQGKCDLALAEYTKAIKLNPYYAVAYYNRGVAYYEQGKYDRAIEDYDKVIQLKPDDAILATTYNSRGTAYTNQEEYDQAIEDYNKAIQLNSDDASFYYGRGNAYDKQEKHDRAIEDYDKAITLKFDFSDAYNNRGVVYGKQGEYKLAIENYDQAIKLNPDDVDAYHNRGTAYANQEKYDQAIENYNKAIKLNPDVAALADTYYHRGTAYYKQKKYDQAIADYDKAIKLNPDVVATYISRGVAYTKQKKYDQAIVDYDKAIKLNPDVATLATAYYNRGNAYANLRKHDRAIKDYDKAIKLNPDDAAVYNNRGNIHAEQEKYDQAIADYDKAIKLNPDVVATYISRGVVYTKQEKYDQAIKDYDKAIKLNPDVAAAYSIRGIAYCGKKKYDQAISDCDKAIKLDPDIAITYVVRGVIYAEQEQHNQAIADYNKAIELDIDVTVLALVYYNRGVSYLNKNKYKLAFKDFLNCNKYDENTKTIYTYVYIVYEINNIFSKKDESKKLETFKLVINLLFEIVAVKKILFYKPTNSSKIAHYTSLHVLKNLTLKTPTGGNSNFRLYNTAYMNDKQEGDSFFDMIKQHDQNKKDYARKFYDDNENYSPSAYVGSFVNVTSKKNKDTLSLWRNYGKHEGEEAAGVCLIFKHDSSRFADEASTMTGTMGKLQAADKKLPATTNEKESKLELYKIAYESGCGEKTELGKELKMLAGQLKKIYKFSYKFKKKRQHQGVYKIVCELLDLIRFLFKTDHYKEEKEVRVVKIHYSFSDSEQPDDEKVQTDDEEKLFPPRFYLNAPDNFCFGEVILGPQAGDEDEWQVWGKQQKGRYKDLKIVKSKIPYGKK